MFFKSSQEVFGKQRVNGHLIQSMDDREPPALEDAQDLSQFPPAPEHLSAESVHGVLSLTVGQRRFFLDPPGRAFGMPPENREGGDIPSETDRIISRFAGNDQAAINIKDGLELALLEGDHRVGGWLAVKVFRH